MNFYNVIVCATEKLFFSLTIFLEVQIKLLKMTFFRCHIKYCAMILGGSSCSRSSFYITLGKVEHHFHNILN